MMDRRNFFKLGAQKSKKAALDVARAGLKLKFPRPFIRPPGAISEERFLLACTRCGDCQTACPHDAVHLVTEISAGMNHKTPFVDPFYAACQYCQDLPCVEACQPGALSKTATPPKMAVASVKEEHCLIAQGQHCDYCFKTCPPGIDALSKNAEGVPKIDPEFCVGCGKCAYICVSQTGRAIEMRPL